MSYRLIDSNALVLKYPEVNEMPCVFADLPDGLNGQHINAQPERKKGKWLDIGDYCVCNQCGHTEQQFNGVQPIPLHAPFCATCGADMREEEAK